MNLDPETKELFPLQLSPVEEFMFHDSFKAYPNYITFRAIFSGKLHIQTMLDAVEIALDRNPTFRCRVLKKNRRLYWVPAEVETHQSQLECGDVRRYSSFIYRSIEELPPLQVHIRFNDAETSVAYSADHTVSDGLGGVVFVEEIITTYHNLCIERELPVEHEANQCGKVKLRRLDAKSLLNRGKYNFLSFAFLKKIFRQAVGLVGVYHFLFKKPAPLKPSPQPDVDGELPKVYPQAIYREIRGSKLNELQQVAIDRKVTVNEILTRDLLVSIKFWRERFEVGDGDDLIRVLIPMNTRQFADRRLPATNRVSFIAIDRKQKEINRLIEFLAGIRGQMGAIQYLELQYTFLLMIRFFRWMPGGLNRITSPKKCGGTAVFSNLGELYSRSKLAKTNAGKLICGNLIVDAIELLGPLRPNTHVNICLHRYAGKLCFTVNYDPRVLDRKEVQSLANIFVRQIERTIETKAIEP